MMHGRRRAGRVHAAAALLGLATLLGCTDVVGSRNQPAPAEEVLAPGIHPVLVLTGQRGGRATLELHLRRVQVEGRIASFQGELKYDAGALALAAAGVPEGITGIWNEVEKGTIRFAGISVEGIEDGAVLSLEFTARGEVGAGHFELAMEELVASAGFADLAPEVRLDGGRPRFTRTERIR